MIAWLLACAQPTLRPVPGTTARIEAVADEDADRMDQKLEIFLDRKACENASVEDVEACLPWLDRASGEVRISFRLLAGYVPIAASVDASQVDPRHKGHGIDRAGASGFELIPHQPEAPRAVYVLLIDGSASMQLVDQGDDRARIEKLRDALLQPAVVQAFFENGSAVAPFMFESADPPRPLAPKVVLGTPAEYRQVIRDQLVAGNAYTWLYRAVDHGVGSILERPELEQAFQGTRRQPVLIALTDGFNNEYATDLCRDNAGRLGRLLERLEQVRRASSGLRPTVWTVGLGREAWKDPRIPRGPGVPTSVLCGPEADRRVSGDLELRGVDNIAMTLIARTGGGRAFVRHDSRGLAEAFRAAAAVRHKWFEVRYRVDPFHLRRAFETELVVDGPVPVSRAVRFHPHGWIDAPPGLLGEDGWRRAAPLSRSALLVLPVLGILVTLGYVPAAAHNLWRALRGRRWFGRKGPRP